MIDASLIDWSRAQFALTACYHWVFVPLTLGLAVIMAVMETIYVVKKDEFWKKTAQFWMKLFGINFAVGIATGLILEFEFGTNWSNYSWFVGDIFGAPLAIEGIFAFFIEATFVAVMFFGWDKVGRRFHLASTWMTGIGAAISAFWILVANGWMQHPVGMEFNPDTVRNEMVDFWAVATNPVAVTKFFHSVLSGWMTGAIFVIGIGCWYLLRKRETRFALASIRVASAVGIIGTLAVMFTGDRSGIHVAKYQPMKLAAAEGLYDGGTRAPFSIVPGLEIPGVLSLLATHDIDGYVPGINDLLDGYVDLQGNEHLSAEAKMYKGTEALRAFRTYRKLKDVDPQAAAEARKVLDANIDCFGYGYIKDRNELVPDVWLVYWPFRIMVGLGFPAASYDCRPVLWAQRKDCPHEMAAVDSPSVNSSCIYCRAGRMDCRGGGKAAVGHPGSSACKRRDIKCQHSCRTDHFLHFCGRVHAFPGHRHQHNGQGDKERARS